MAKGGRISGLVGWSKVGRSTVTIGPIRMSAGKHLKVRIDDPTATALRVPAGELVVKMPTNVSIKGLVRPSAIAQTKKGKLGTPKIASGTVLLRTEYGEAIARIEQAISGKGASRLVGHTTGGLGRWVEVEYASTAPSYAGNENIGSLPGGRVGLAFGPLPGKGGTNPD